MVRNAYFPAFAAGLCILLLAGCSDDGPSDPGGGELPVLPEWDGRREFIGTLTFAGRERSFIGHLPLSYDHERRVLAYHGSGMGAELMRQATGLDWIANEHGFAVIYPDASDGFFPIPCPDCQNDGRDGFEEINFAREIIRWTSETYAVHPDSVYATGFSMGGFHSILISANPPDLFDYVGLFSPGTPSGRLSSSLGLDLTKPANYNLEEKYTLPL